MLYNIYILKFRPDTEIILGALATLGPAFHVIQNININNIK